jgi:hypothetical protein
MCEMAIPVLGLEAKTPVSIRVTKMLTVPDPRSGSSTSRTLSLHRHHIHVEFEY